MNRVCILLVNWNGWRDTVECLETVFRSDYTDYRVVVSDNGSTDNSLDHIKAWAENQVSHAPSSQGQYAQLFAESLKKTISFVEYGAAVAEQGGAPEARDVPLVLIRNDSNLGFAGGNNVGLRYALARGDFAYVWLLNNDTVVTPCSLSHLVTRLQQRTDAGMCGSTLLNYRNPHKVQALGGGYYCRWIGLPWHLGRLRRSGGQINRAKVEKWTNFVVGASMLVSREFLLDVGLMCEDYFLYFEEADWAMRARNRYKLVYAPESVVYHKIGASIGTSSNPNEKSYTCDYYNVRNRLFFTRRYFPYAMPAIYITLLGTLLTRIFLGKWDRALMVIRLFYCYRKPNVPLPK